MTCISQIENHCFIAIILPSSVYLYPCPSFLHWYLWSPFLSHSLLFFPPIYLFLTLSICVLFFKLTDQSLLSSLCLSLSDHIFEQVVINDIQRLMNYSPKRDRKYRERKKGNSKREDERGGRRGVRWRGRKEEEGTGDAKETNDEGGVRWRWKAWCLSCNVSEEIVCVCSHAKVSEVKSKFHNGMLIVWPICALLLKGINAVKHTVTGWNRKKKVILTLDMEFFLL